ncbi:MAG TPA: hypothetical protein VHN78_11580 [Chloroflexota bacterium]|nr:hypothetical protein [Chloroflexota bacterium]
MAEPQPRREASPSTTPDSRAAAGGTQSGEPLKTAAEVAAARLAETVEEGRAMAPSAGGDVPVPGEEQITGAVAGVVRRYPAASMLMALGMGLGLGLLVGRRRGQATTAAGA